MIDYIFIDIDNTITNNYHIHTKGWDYIKMLWNKNDIQVDYNLYHGLKTKQAISKLADDTKYKLEENELIELVKTKNILRNIEISKLDSTNLYKNVDLFFETLYNRNIKFVTYSLSTASKEIIEALCLNKYFSDYLYGDFFEISKNKSCLCLKKYLEHHNINTDQILIIDDDYDVVKIHRDNGFNIIQFNSLNSDFYIDIINDIIN